MNFQETVCFLLGVLSKMKEGKYKKKTTPHIITEKLSALLKAKSFSCNVKG